jgi:hypothetical protein
LHISITLKSVLTIIFLGLEPPPPPTPTTNTLSPSTNNLNEDFRTKQETVQKPVDEPQKDDLAINPNDDQRLLQFQMPTNEITSNSSELTNIESHSQSSIHSPEQTLTESPNLTPTIVHQQQQDKSKQVENSLRLRAPCPSKSKNLHSFTCQKMISDISYEIKRKLCGHRRAAAAALILPKISAQFHYAYLF